MNYVLLEVDCPNCEEPVQKKLHMPQKEETIVNIADFDLFEAYCEKCGCYFGVNDVENEVEIYEIEGDFEEDEEELEDLENDDEEDEENEEE